MSGTEPPSQASPSRGEPAVHPWEALAGYVDGTATVEERSIAQRHLADCAACREDVDAARRGLEAMLALPEAAAPGIAGAWRPPEPVLAPSEAEPVGVGAAGPPASPASRRARMMVGRRRGLLQRRPLLSGVGIAAAAAVVVAVLVLTTRPTPSSTTAAGPASGGPTATAGGYDGTSLAAYARSLLPLAESRLRAANRTVPSSGSKASANGFGSLAVRAPAACATRLVGLVDAPLISAKRAEFQGKPAWILAFLESPSQSPHLVVIAVPTTGCSLYFYTRLPVPSG